jgi:nucleoside-diphosphate-sugar epimerase
VSYGQEYGLDTRIARLSYIYGGNFQKESSKADVQFLKKALAGEDIVMKSSGLQFRSYCYLQDAVKGILYIMLKGSSGEAYNVANPKTNVTIREFAEILAKCAGVKVMFEHPEDVESKGYSKLGKEVLNPEKLEKLGYRASVGLEEAFGRILKMEVK